MSKSNEHDHDELLQRATRTLNETSIPDGPPDAVVESLLAAVQAETDLSKPTTLRRRIFTMKSILKSAVAVTVLLVLGVGLFWLLAQSGPKPAFADMADAFLSIQTVTCRITTTDMEMKQPGSETKVKATSTGKLLFRGPNAQRVEMEVSAPNTGKTKAMKMSLIQISDFAKGEILSLMPATKTGVLLQIDNLPDEAKQKGNFLDMRTYIEQAKNGKDNMKVEPLGEQKIDGQTAVGYSIQQTVLRMRMNCWFDPITALPIRMETTIGGKTSVHMVLDDFRSGTDLDESLFSLVPPKGYKIQQAKMDASNPTVADLTELLRATAEENQGQFPDTLPDITAYKNLVAHRAATVSKDHKNTDIQATMNLIIPIGRGFQFLAELKPENNQHYAGKGIKLDTPDVPIFWYKPIDSETYQVVFADLSVKEMEKKELLPMESHP